MKLTRELLIELAEIDMAPGELPLALLLCAGAGIDELLEAAEEFSKPTVRPALVPRSDFVRALMGRSADAPERTLLSELEDLLRAEYPELYELIFLIGG